MRLSLALLMLIAIWPTPIASVKATDVSNDPRNSYLHKLAIYATKGRCFFGGLAVEMAAISTGGEGGDGRRHNGRRGDVEWLIERGA